MRYPLRGIVSLIAVLAVALVATPAPAESPGNTHPLTVHDMLAMKRISDLQLSSDGTRVAFVVRTTDLDANRGRTDLWTVNVDGTGLLQLTSDPAGDSNPRWSHDGRTVWFLSSRSGSSQVWRIPVAGGEARRVTDLPLDVTSLAVSPTGDDIAFSMDVFPDCDGIDCTKTRLDEVAAGMASGRIYDKLFIRHWDTWKDGRRSHVFVLPAEGETPVDVMAGMDADCPSKPFGGPEEYVFTPDGRGIVLSARDVGRSEAWSTDFDLYRAPADGSSPPRCLTEPNAAWDTNPVFSPDGKTLAYLAMRLPGYESDRLRIVLRSWPDGKPRVLTGDWDHSPRSIAWSPDGRTLHASADNLGQRSLFAIDVASGKVQTVVEDGTVRGFARAGDTIVYGRDDLRSPVELYAVGPDGGNPRRITRLNDEALAKVRMGEPEQFTFAGWNDETVHAYLVKPVDFDPSKSYPVAFLIHGGPQGSFGNDFHYRWNPQAYAGAGYAAVMVDFHGSTGYGQDFTDSIRGDWGGKPLVDLRRGLQAALDRYSFLDGERACALGASFGGYMVNWIAGQWPEGFKCLVNHDGNLDERLAYFDTEELWFPEWDHMGAPWLNPEGYEKHNPVNHVGNWKTPMLVVHGALDYRVVETQGMSTFTALQRQGIPSRLLYFPDENHWVLKPHNSILWHETVLDWLDQWTAGERDAAAAATQVGADPGADWLVYGYAGEEPDRLATRWPVGKRLVYAVSVRQAQGTGVEGSELETAQRVEQKFRYSIAVGKSDELTLSLIAARMRSEGATAPLIYDSEVDTERETGNPMAEAFDKLIGVDARVGLAADGTVERIGGVDQFLEQMASESSPQAQAFAASFFTRTSIEKMVRVGLESISLPDEPVRSGDSWPCGNNLLIGSLGELESRVECTHAGREKLGAYGAIRIDFEGTLHTTTEGAGPMGTKVTVVEGTTSGTTWLDEVRGIVVKARTTQDMRLKLEVPGHAGGMTSKMQQQFETDLLEFTDLD